MSTVERTPWKRLSDKALHDYEVLKEKQQDNTIHYSLTEAAAAKLKTSSTKVKAKAKAKVKVPAKKKVTFKKSTKNVKVEVSVVLYTSIECSNGISQRIVL